MISHRSFAIGLILTVLIIGISSERPEYKCVDEMGWMYEFDRPTFEFINKSKLNEVTGEDVTTWTCTNEETGEEVTIVNEKIPVIDGV